MLTLFSWIRGMRDEYFGRIKKKKDPAMEEMVITLFLILAAWVCDMIYNSLPFLTRFFPFSLLYQDKLFHYHHRHLRKVIYRIEGVMEKAGRPILFLYNSYNQHFLTLEGIMQKKNISDEKMEKIVKNTFQLEGTDIFVRSMKPAVKKLLIDREVFENLI